MNIDTESYCTQRQSSVIPVTNYVFNAAWQKLCLSDGTLGRHGRPDWSVIKSTDPKDLFEGWTDGRTRTDEIRVGDLQALGIGKAVNGLALCFKSEPGSALHVRECAAERGLWTVLSLVECPIAFSSAVLRSWMFTSPREQAVRRFRRPKPWLTGDQRR
jgi:hypothetical protein